MVINAFDLLVPITKVEETGVKMEIYECRYLGGGGSGVYGRPINVDDHLYIQELRRKVAARARRPLDDDDNEAEESEIRSQVQSQVDMSGSRENSLDVTASAFATQIPLPEPLGETPLNIQADIAARIQNKANSPEKRSQGSDADRSEKDSQPGQPSKKSMLVDVDETHNGSLHAHGVKAQQMASLAVVERPQALYSNDPWQGLVRIRRRDVRIPKDQEKLLEDKTCWLPPEPGQRGPVTNIPVPILADLNALAEKRANGPELEREEHVDSEGLTPGSMSKQQEEPDLAAAESEGEDDASSIVIWPSTPPRLGRVERLPPDSSPEPSVVGGRNARQEERRLSSVRQDEVAPDSPPLERRRLAVADDNVAARIPLDPSERHVAHDEPDESPNRDDSNPSEDVIPGKVPCLQSAQDLSISTHEARHESLSRGPVPCQQTHQHHTRSHSSTSDSERSIVDSPEPAVELKRPSVVGTDSEADQSELETCVPNALGEKVNVGESSSSLDTNSIRHNAKSATTVDDKQAPQMNRRSFASQETKAAAFSSSSNFSSLVLQQPSSDQLIPITFSSHPSLQASDVTSRILHPEDPSQCGLDDSSEVNQQLLGKMERFLRNVRKQNPEQSHQSLSQVLETEEPGTIRPNQVPSEEELTDMEDTRQTIYSSGQKKRNQDPADELARNPTKKRQKRFKAPPTFDFGEEKRLAQDPSELNRQQRRDFMKYGSKSDPCQHLDPSPQSSSPQALQFAFDRGRHPMDNEEPMGRHPAAEKEPTGPAASRSESVVTPSRVETLCQRPGNWSLSGSVSPRLSLKAQSLQISGRASGADSALPNSRDRPTSTNANIYGTFTDAYPRYEGNLEAFVSSCAYIEWLVGEKRMEHKSLWDDFIYRHVMDYEDWVSKRERLGKSFVPYETFYREEVDEPTCTRRIVSPQTLMLALQLDPVAAGKMRYDIIPKLNGLEQDWSLPQRAMSSMSKRSFESVDRDLPTRDLGPSFSPVCAVRSSSVVDDTPSKPATKTNGGISSSAVADPQHGKPTPVVLDGGKPAANEVRESRQGNSTSPAIRSPPASLSAQRRSSSPTGRLWQTMNKGTSKASGKASSTKPLSRLSSTMLGSGEIVNLPLAEDSDRLVRGTPRSKVSNGGVCKSQSTTIQQAISRPKLKRSKPPGQAAAAAAIATKAKDERPQIQEERRRETRKVPWREFKGWEDRNTPFKRFGRAYVQLKEVNGRMGGVDEVKGNIVPPKGKLDVMKWSV